jgi:TRAP transporter 4TM/12TM fusion protein
MARRVLAISITAWSVIYIFHLIEYLPFIKLFIAPAQHQAIFLGSILPLAFLYFPAKKNRKGLRWYDYILIVMSVVPNAYVVFFYDLWQYHAGTHSTSYELVFLIALFIALLEGLRRVLGIILPILTLCFAIHPLVCNYLPGILFGRGYTFDRVTTQFFLPSDGIYSLPLNISATIVIAFLFFGQLLVASGGGKTLMDLALSAVGRVRGGGAKASVVASGLFGTLSGSPTSNVATTGTFTVPMMKSTGYRPAFAAGVEATASNGGQLMPPVMGVVAFLMAEMLQVPYFQVCYTAFIPAVLYYILIFLQVDFEAARKGLKGLEGQDLPSVIGTLKSGWPHVLPVIILVYFLFIVKYSPELCALFSSVAIVVIGVFRRKNALNLARILEAMEGSARTAIIVVLACAMAGLMMGSVSLTGIAISISGDLVRIAGGNLFLLLVLAAITCFIFGMGMGSIPCYIFVSIMVAPALAQMGIPLIIAHLFVFWLALSSFITPPVCIAAYVAAAIAECSPMRAGVWATRIGIGIFIVPFAFVYNQGLVLYGSPLTIATTIIFSLIGALFTAAGLEGYLLTTTKLWQRIIFLIFGLMMFFPSLKVRLFALTLLAIASYFQLKSPLLKQKSASESQFS